MTTSKFDMMMEELYAEGIELLDRIKAEKLKRKEKEERKKGGV